jgi:LEA14-like dessication related protein
MIRVCLKKMSLLRLTALRSVARCLVVLVLATALGGCALMENKLESIEVSLVDVAPNGITLLEQRFEVTIRVRNPNEVAIAATGLRFTLELNGVRFLRGLSSGAFKVPRLGEILVKTHATISAFDMLQQIAVLGRGRSFTYRLKGTLFRDEFLRPRLPFENQGRLDLPGLLGAVKEPAGGNR